MHLLTIVAFAFLFWRGEDQAPWILVPDEDVAWTLATVLGLVGGVSLAAVLASRRTAYLFRTEPGSLDAAQHFHHRANTALRFAIGIGFGVLVFATRWPDWFDIDDRYPYLQILLDLVVLSPFVVTLIVHWIANYPIERMMRGDDSRWRSGAGAATFGSWGFRPYLEFHIRHYILVVAVPMALILFTADMTRGYGEELRAWSRWQWTPDVLLGCVACLVFVIAPVILRRIWWTSSLEAGPTRQRLERLAQKVGLGFRDILKWNSDGLMINAAVMGLIAPIRYVLLSDGLLSAMSTRQVESVFGHEVGHIRHRHIQHFLVFAYVGWLLTAGTMEGLAYMLLARGVESTTAIQLTEGIGVLVAVVIWGAGFGWLSRRFERQADLFAARCVTPDAAGCTEPCGVHPRENESDEGDHRLCATGAAIFASALDRVAVLNGIPHDEYSWRHSSIGYRIRFLTSLAGDPNRLARFEKVVRRAKRAMLVIAIVGSLVGGIYWMAVDEPAVLRLQANMP